ncbi:c-Myc-binding protein homolog isoform X2 [Monomorium pharaonis]|nr:c-Myc-binding protein homolog isoform X2 [Monomorium pharaonis]
MAQQEEFRKYLERSGVMDALTRILVKLYEESEKPTDALDYIRKTLGDIVEDSNTVEIDSLKKELKESKAQIAELKAKLSKYEQKEATTE